MIIEPFNKQASDAKRPIYACMMRLGGGMSGHRDFVVRRDRAVHADEIRRSAGRRLAAPLIAAGLIVAGEFALQSDSAQTAQAPRARPQPALEAPAFVRPSKPSLNIPDIRVSRQIQIGSTASSPASPATARP